MYGVFGRILLVSKIHHLTDIVLSEDFVWPCVYVEYTVGRLIRRTLWNMISESRLMMLFSSRHEINRENTASGRGVES